MSNLKNSHKGGIAIGKIAGQIVLTNRWRVLKFSPAQDGVVAQLVEHHNGIVGVAGSIPVGSTIQFR